MTKQNVGGIVAVALMLTGTLAMKVDAQQAQPPALTESGQKLEAGYAAQLQTLRAEIEKALPQIDASKKAAFLEAIKDRTSAAAQDKMIKAVAELNLTPALSDAKLDPKLVKIVVLQTAKPRGLAEFAQQGAEQGVPRVAIGRAERVHGERAVALALGHGRLQHQESTQACSKPDQLKPPQPGLQSP